MEGRNSNINRGDRDSYNQARKPLQNTTLNVPYSSPSRYSKLKDEDASDLSCPETPTRVRVSRPRVKVRVGPWLLGRTLGKGSSGRVRLAKHMETGQLAAVKIVGKGYDDGSGGDIGSSLNRPLPPGLEREVVIMKLICHPNVIGLWDVWENRGELYLVLEYIEGGELFEYLSRRGRLPEAEAVMYMRQILAGIDYCQHFNICHRDLKPENLLLDANGNIKIADFGMAALQPHGSLLDTPCGSPHYASPEIVAGKQYDGAKSDIWSCGVILFALLAGYLPFDEDNIRKLLQKVARGRFAMPPEFSVAAQDLIMRMLTIDPEHRISMVEIWNHPLLRMYAPLDPITGEETDRGPKPPRSRDIGRPVNSKWEIDREIVKNLQTLWQGVRESTLIERLLSNVHNQEKVFYCLLMKYRSEHLEDFPGKEDDRRSRQSPKSLARHAGNSQEHCLRTASRRGNHFRNEGAYDDYADSRRSVSDYRPLTRGKPVADQEDHVRYSLRERAVERVRSMRSRGSGEHSHQGGRSASQTSEVASGGSVNGSTPYSPTAHLRATAVSNRYHSRSSLASRLSSRSPSVYRSSAHFKRRVSFNRSLNSRHGKSGKYRASRPAQMPTDWLDDEVGTRIQAVGFVRGDTPPYDPVPLGFSKRRKDGASGAKTHSEGFANGGFASGNTMITPIRGKAACAREKEEEERRRIVSQELEEACDRAFASVGTSIRTLSTLRSVCETTLDPSIHTVNSALFGSSQLTASSATTPSGLDKSSYVSIYEDERPLPTLPPEALIRRCSDGRKVLDILTDSEADPDKGYLSDVLEYFDKLMERPFSFQSPANQRGISQGGKPLNTAGNASLTLPKISENKKYLEGPSRSKGLGATHGGGSNQYRTVSAPQSQGNPLAARNPNRQSSKREPAHKIGPASQGLHPQSAMAHYGDRGDFNARGERNWQLHSIEDASRGFGPDLILPAPRQEANTAEFVVGDKNHRFIEKGKAVMGSTLEPGAPGVKQVKKKRSFFDVLTGRKNDTKKEQTDGKSKKVAETKNSAVRENAEVVAAKETFGKRSGNLLDRWASRDLLGFGGFNGEAIRFLLDRHVLTVIDRPPETQNLANGFTSCFVTPQEPEDDARFTAVEEDQFNKVMSQRSWFMKFLNVKPASRVVCFNISPVATRKEIMKLWKEWVKYGLIIVGDDRKALVMRARVGTPNSLNIKEVSLVGEIRAYGGSRKTGAGVVRFTQEKGAASSFNRVIGEIVRVFSEKGIILPDE